MKRYQIYRDIRKRALIFGLPLHLFAIMMIGILVSLLIIIFSFSTGIILGVLIINLGLYATLVRITNHSQYFHIARVFPKTISNKLNSDISYE